MWVAADAADDDVINMAATMVDDVTAAARRAHGRSINLFSAGPGSNGNGALERTWRLVQARGQLGREGVSRFPNKTIRL